LTSNSERKTANATLWRKKGGRERRRRGLLRFREKEGKRRCFRQGKKRGKKGNTKLVSVPERKKKKGKKERFVIKKGKKKRRPTGRSMNKNIWLPFLGKKRGAPEDPLNSGEEGGREAFGRGKKKEGAETQPYSSGELSAVWRRRKKGGQKLPHGRAH